MAARWMARGGPGGQGPPLDGTSEVARTQYQRLSGQQYPDGTEELGSGGEGHQVDISQKSTVIQSGD